MISILVVVRKVTFAVKNRLNNNIVDTFRHGGLPNDLSIGIDTDHTKVIFIMTGISAIIIC